MVHIVPDDQIAFLLVTGLCSGMSIITCGFVLLTLGVSFNLRSDRNRQQFLALVSLSAAIFAVIGNGLQVGRIGRSLCQRIVSFFFNWCVQLGLAGIAHTSVIRLLTAVLRSPAPAMLSRATLLCCIFYVFTLPVMTPTFITVVHPSNTAAKTVSRNMNIAIVCTTELLAVISDVMLLHRFTQHKERGGRVRSKMIKDMWILYVCVWLSVCADITAKVYRDVSNTLLPDLAITNLTLTLRCLAALIYGTTIRNAHEVYTLPSFSWSNPVPKNPEVLDPKAFAINDANSDIQALENERLKRERA